MRKIVFLGAKEIAKECLEWLLSICPQYHAEIIAIGTSTSPSNSTSIKDIAHNNSIPLIAHQDEILDCDYIISVQYHDILKSENIQKASEIAINLHLAPIPEYRGCNQFSFAIFNEEREFGVTIHQINTLIDHGRIVSEERFPIPEDIWVHDLWKMSNDKGLQLFKNTIPSILENKYTLTDWRSLNREERIYYRKDI